MNPISENHNNQCKSVIQTFQEDGTQPFVRITDAHRLNGLTQMGSRRWQGRQLFPELGCAGSERGVIERMERVGGSIPRGDEAPVCVNSSVKIIIISANQ